MAQELINGYFEGAHLQRNAYREKPHQIPESRNQNQLQPISKLTGSCPICPIENSMNFALTFVLQQEVILRTCKTLSSRSRFFAVSFYSLRKTQNP